MHKVLQAVTCNMSVSGCMRPFPVPRPACTPAPSHPQRGAGVLCIATEFPQDPTDIFHYEKGRPTKLSLGPLLSYDAAVFVPTFGGARTASCDEAHPEYISLGI